MSGVRLAFGCQARVGKDHAAAYLVKRYGGRILRFSEPLYDIMYYAQDKAGFPRSKDVRFLQMVGTDWARTIKPDVWAECLVASLKDIPADENVFVVDVRFENEAELLRKNGFHIVRIVRPNAVIDRDITHISETSGLSYKYDAVIDNDSDVATFESRIENLFLQLRR